MLVSRCSLALSLIQIYNEMCEVTKGIWQSDIAKVNCAKSTLCYVTIIIYYTIQNFGEKIWAK